MKRTALSLILLPLAAFASAFQTPKTAAAYLTAKDTGLRLTSTGTLTFSDFPQPLETQPFVQVDPAKTFQTMIGIGGAPFDRNLRAPRASLLLISITTPLTQINRRDKVA